MWQADGRGVRAMIGVLTPHLDPVPETEFQAMAPDGVSIHAARVPLGMVDKDGTIVTSIGPAVVKAFAEPPHVDRAASRLAALRLSAIVYAFTSSSYVLGATADCSLAKRLCEKAGGTPVIVQCQALLLALDALDVAQIDLIHPPWFSPELDDLGARYFQDHSVDVARHGPAAISRTYSDLRPKELFDWVVDHATPDADALVIGGGGFRAIGTIEALEEELQRPVLSANQAAFWNALRLAGISDELNGYGRLFSVGLPQA